MDLGQLVRDLRAQLEAVDRAIASLENLQKTRENPQAAPEKKRRGRKGMGEEERRIVSQRMKRYWASRRKQQKRGVVRS